MSIRLLLSIFSVFPLILFGQQDYWDVYLAKYEKGMGSTLVNMTAKTYAPNKDYPFVLICGVAFTNCTSEGMPTKEQFSDLYITSDSIKAILDSKVRNISVGTFTYQCERLDYFYLKDTIGIRGSLLNIYSKYFQSYKAYINLKEDKLWGTYLTFLYPNDETFEFMQNEKVLSKLTEQGDKLEKPRIVDHWIYFATETDQKCFIAYATRSNFKIESKEKTKQPLMPYKLHISRIDKVDIRAISRITLELRNEVKKCNGDYDGWETSVEKD